MEALKIQDIPYKRKYALDVQLENLVKAYLGGFLSKVTEPSKEVALWHSKSVDPLQQVLVGQYNLVHKELVIRSDIRSACAVLGVKAQDIADLLLKMRLHDEMTDKSHPAVTVDTTCKGVLTDAVTSLEAVYIACKHVLLEKTIRNNQNQTKSKLKGV